MAKKKKKRVKPKKKKNYIFVIISLSIIFLLGLGTLGYFYKNQIIFYYTMYFRPKAKNTLTNSDFETKRIDKIIKAYSHKTFGLDISHYQEQKDIDWERLTIFNEAIPLEFIILRATMGNDGKDKNFKIYWEKAKKHNLVKGAYHFYRPDEDPIAQANIYISVVKLQSGDIKPVLDIEKLPKKKSKEKFLQDIKIWLRLVERHYNEKPIIYSYYHFYKDYLRGHLDEYPLWLANYNDVPQPSDIDKWKIWQFTENGISDGINTKIDLNIYNGTLSEMKELMVD